MSAGPGPRTLAPGMKARNFSATWKRLIHELRPERWRIGLVIALTAVSVVLNVLAPKVLARATNLIFEGVIGTLLGHLGLPAGMSGDQLVAALRAAGQDTYVSMLSAYDVVVGQGLDTRALLIVLAQVLALYLTSAVFLWLQGRILAGVVQRTASRMRGEVEAKLARVPLSYIDRGSRGDMLSRVTNDVDNVSQTLQQTLSQAFNSIITVIGVFAMMLTVSWQLTLVAVVTIPLAMIISVLIARQAKPHFTQQWKATGEVSGVVEEAFTGHEAVALFNSEETFADLFEQANNRLYEGSYKAQWISGTIQPAMRVVSNLNFVIIAVVGGIRITQGAMTLGDVQAFIQYSQQFTQPITQLASMANLLQSGAASAERVFEVLDAPEESEDTQDRLLPERVCGRVVFDHVRFSYTPDTELITDLNLTVEPGQTVAIVGPTGAGKTTLVNLLLRFYDPQSGTISLDGVDNRDVARGELREQIGMVLQDTWLFEGTIRENITFGAASASQEQVLAAARAASVDHIIRALPQGYDTVIDDSGSGVSAGEKQLITIARAFLADRQILVLDEATSSVDTRTELLVQKAMVGLRQGRTSFVIAHRLSTIRDADVILVMEHGDIVEQGSHDELMARHGAYFELYQSQFSGPADEESAASGDRA
ncbi:ABC transporter transmembrane domain-containing protein [Actinomyces urogenitalis]|nr:ABC transporter transmembrane domain-containing protein [Actinomyces urogenitalis]MBS5976266.1 ATP-binding cassette domain-containing protein [Actinomyces urogenitalis]MBS6071652.1 ATP-binding cassette domain-containing protein [Actinomyces urogenitalis]MDK8835826.1 ABC transporter transmembrane domain-containing protein [Actinomyces urogenitalis]MDU5426802.1 ABC transporter transmembrane domain-containing protein [Actinomyces urogenitalis]MDU5875283.1 ABC transporter transmembrane domain-c